MKAIDFGKTITTIEIKVVESILYPIRSFSSIEMILRKKLQFWHDNGEY